MSVRESLLANNRFLVSIGPLLLSFAKITNISDSLETEAIQEGGNNWSPQLLVKPKTSAQTLVLERGVQTGNLTDLLLSIGSQVEVGTIMVMGQNRLPSKVYAFDSGLVTKWEIGELDAMGKDILIKKLEISHSGLYEVL